MYEGREVPPFLGVRSLDHTADVGLELEAPDLPELLRRAVRGMAWLLLECEPPGASSPRTLRVEAPDAPGLLRELLRELLWWHEGEGFTALDLDEAAIEETGSGLRLEASVLFVRDVAHPLREIKGVTLHGLLAAPGEDGWHGQVIFDV